jgi:hypothetical protein
MAKARNPYRSGTASHARFRKAALKRKSALAQATAARAKTPERSGLDLARMPRFFDRFENPQPEPIPGVDAKGRALVRLMREPFDGEILIFRARRTRALAWHTMDARLRFVRAINDRRRGEADLPSARKARGAFRKALRDARDRDCAAEAARG